MWHSDTWWAIALAGLVAVFCAGCPWTGEPEPDGQQAARREQPFARDFPATPQPEKEPEPPPPPPTVPEVQMPEALRETCLVLVGDQMPGGELKDLAGESKSLAELFGEKLTVILFWTRGDSPFSPMAATAALEDLQKDVAEPYGGKGVAVVAINVNDPAEQAAENVNQAETTFPQLSDPEGKFFAQAATEGLPRVYLLDAQGKIIWFDLEFSRTSRRNLIQAIQVELGEI